MSIGGQVPITKNSAPLKALTYKSGPISGSDFNLSSFKENSLVVKLKTGLELCLNTFRGRIFDYRELGPNSHFTKVSMVVFFFYQNSHFFLSPN